MTITEKIDGTNAAVIIAKWTGEEIPPEAKLVVGPSVGSEEPGMYLVAAQSRKRLIKPGKKSDNFGFAGWVSDNAYDLVRILGPGHHYGEWWGQSIQRGYGIGTRVFSLFNAERYFDMVTHPDGDPHLAGLETVPVLYEGMFSQEAIEDALRLLRESGSMAAPNFKNAEGIIVYHSASRQVYKVLLESDDKPKALVA